VVVGGVWGEGVVVTDEGEPLGVDYAVFFELLDEGVLLLADLVFVGRHDEYWSRSGAGLRGS